MTALIEAAKSADYPAEIVGVFSNRTDAPGLAAAAAEGVPTASRSHRDFATREDLTITSSRYWRRGAPI